MLRLAFEFPAGRYHATPWGRHVNEGVVEWPPSPWRLVRALVATGFAKLGWTDPPPDASALLTRLCSVPPEYWLPPAAGAHTRHYMPVYKGSADKVIDAFLHVGTGAAAVLGVEWAIELSNDETLALDRLLPRLTYLGRAESWADARRVDAIPDGLQRCAPSQTAPGPAYERIELLAPATSDAYADWRAAAFQREHDVALGAEREKAESKGKSPPSKLGKKHVAKIDELLPGTLIDALRMDTNALQKAGWSLPPGARWLSYWRRDDAVRSTIPGQPRRESAQRFDTALLALASDTQNGEALPKVTDTLRRAEMLHATLVSAASKASDRLASSLTGKGADGVPLRGHVHAHLVPLCLDSAARGQAARIDHFLVHAPMGFDHAALRALHGVRKTYAKNLPTLFVTLAGLGQLDDFASLVPHARRAAAWVSATPFVPPRHLKQRGRHSLEGQIRAELAGRGMPMPASIGVEIERGQRIEYVAADEFWSLWRQQAASVVVGGDVESSRQTSALPRLSTRWRHFRRVRSREGREPPVAAGFGLRLVFAEDVPGPIALGYASHFGLGLFIPGAHGSVDT